MTDIDDFASIVELIKSSRGFETGFQTLTQLAARSLSLSLLILD
ncbi:hypothetical protein RBB78_06185 [Tunturiibacter empetritectus]